MHSFHDLADRAPQWQPALRWKRHFELRDSGLLYASLSWEKASGAIVVARTADDLWIFERTGPQVPRVHVRRAPQGGAEALFHADWIQGGRLVTAEGESWLWGSNPQSRSAWSFRASGAGARLDVTLESLHVAPSGRVRFSEGLEQSPTAPLLACLGWYLAVSVIDDASLLVPSFAAAV